MMGMEGVSPSHSSPLTATIMYQDQHMYQDQQNGTYTVNSDCTGTETIPDPDPTATVSPHTYATIIAPDGSEIVFVGTDPVTPDEQGVKLGVVQQPCRRGWHDRLRLSGHRARDTRGWRTGVGGMRRLALCAVERMSVTGG